MKNIFKLLLLSLLIHSINSMEQQQQIPQAQLPLQPQDHTLNIHQQQPQSDHHQRCQSLRACAKKEWCPYLSGSIMCIGIFCIVYFSLDHEYDISGKIAEWFK